MKQSIANIILITALVLTISETHSVGADVGHSECINLTTDMSVNVNSRIADVLTLQNFLGNMGYIMVMTTGYFRAPGYFTTETEDGVKEFQRVHGIPVTGYVGPLTRTAIQNSSCGTNSATATVNVTCPAGYVCTRNSSTAGTQNATSTSSYVPGSFYNSYLGNINTDTTNFGANQAADYNTLSDLPVENVDVAKTINTVSNSSTTRVYTQRDYDVTEIKLNNSFPGSDYGQILDMTTSSSSYANGYNEYINKALSSDPRNKPCKYMATDRFARALQSMLTAHGIQADFISASSTIYVINYRGINVPAPTLRCLDRDFSMNTAATATILTTAQEDMFKTILKNRFPGSSYGALWDITTSGSSPANGYNGYINKALSSDPRNTPCKYMVTDRVAHALQSMLTAHEIQADFITSTSTNYILNYYALGTPAPTRCLDAGFSQNIAAFQTPMYILSSTTYSVAVDYNWASNYDITKTDFWNDPANQFTIAWNMNVYWQKAQKLFSTLSTLEMNRFAGIKTPITLFHFTASTTGKLTAADADTKLAAMGYRAADTNELFALNKAGLAPYNTVALNSFQLIKSLFTSCDTLGAVESASVPGHCAKRLNAVAATGAYNGNGLTMPFNPDTGIRLQDWNFTNGTSFYFAAVKL